MKEIKKRNKRLIYFAPKPKFNLSEFKVFIQSDTTRTVFGFKKTPFYTKYIHLSEDVELMSSFSRNTRSEIRKAIKEGVEFKLENRLGYFVDFYNDFAHSLNLSTLSSEDLRLFGDSIVITKSVSNEETLTMHSYIIDDELHRVRLLHSASLHKNIVDKKERALIGRANRFLHYKDMLHFKSKGFEIYDLGGYAYQTEDKHMQNINKFKDSFGGELVENSNYVPIHFYIAGKIKSLIRG